MAFTSRGTAPPRISRARRTLWYPHPVRGEQSAGTPSACEVGRRVASLDGHWEFGELPDGFDALGAVDAAALLETAEKKQAALEARRRAMEAESQRLRDARAEAGWAGDARAMMAHQRFCTSCAFADDGRTAVSAGGDGALLQFATHGADPGRARVAMSIGVRRPQPSHASFAARLRACRLESSPPPQRP